MRKTDQRKSGRDTNVDRETAGVGQEIRSKPIHNQRHQVGEKMENLTKYEAWEPLVICRKDIKNLPRNPRVISAAAKRRLKKILETDGMLGPVNYNPKTGNVYGGNQRLALLDALEGSDTYFMTVAAAKKLSPARERKAVTYLNSQEAQGDWDLAALSGWLKDSPDFDPKNFDPEEYGFSQVSLEVALGEDGAGIFAPANEETQNVVDDLAEMSTARDSPEEEDGGVAEKNAAVERRQKMREKGKEDHEAGDTERLIYVMCQNRKQREDAMERWGQPRNARYISLKDIPETKP